MYWFRFQILRHSSAACAYGCYQCEEASLQVCMYDPYVVLVMLRWTYRCLIRSLTFELIPCGSLGMSWLLQGKGRGAIVAGIPRLQMQ